MLELILLFGFGVVPEDILEAGTFVVLALDCGDDETLFSARRAAAARRCSRKDLATFCAAETPDLMVFTSSRLTFAGMGIR